MPLQAADTSAIDQRIATAEKQLDTTQQQQATQKEAELGGLEKQLGAAEAQPLPVRPQIPIPQAPQQKPPVDSKEYQNFASAITAMAMIAGAAGGRERWTNVLTSLNGALSGYLEGSQEKAQQEYANFDRQFKEAMSKQQQANEEFNDILNQRNKSINQIMTEYRIASAKWGRADANQAVEERRIDRMYQSKQQYDIAHQRLQEQYDAINARVESAKEKPVKLLTDDSGNKYRLLASGQMQKETDGEWANISGVPPGLMPIGGTVGVKNSQRQQLVVASSTNALNRLAEIQKKYGPTARGSIAFGEHPEGMIGKLKLGTYRMMQSSKQKETDADIAAMIDEAIPSLTGGLRGSDSYRQFLISQVPTFGDSDKSAAEKWRVFGENIKGVRDVFRNKFKSDPKMRAPGQEGEQPISQDGGTVKGGTIIKLDAQGNEIQ